MKIAVSVKGSTLESPIDTRFGRAKNFILFDTTNNEFDVFPNNQNLNAAQGAGIQAGQNVVELDADCLITGHCGPKAFKVLESGDVDIYLGVPGTVRDNLDQFLAGTMSRAESADVKGHWM